MIYQNSDKATYRLNYRDIDQNLTQGKGNGFENYVRLVAEKFNSKPRHVSNAMLAENLGIRNGTLDTILAHAQKDYGITINRRRSTEQVNKLAETVQERVVNGEDLTEVAKELGLSRNYAKRLYNRETESSDNTVSFAQRTAEYVGKAAAAVVAGVGIGAVFTSLLAGNAIAANAKSVDQIAREGGRTNIAAVVQYAVADSKTSTTSKVAVTSSTTGGNDDPFKLVPGYTKQVLPVGTKVGEYTITEVRPAAGKWSKSFHVWDYLSNGKLVARSGVDKYGNNELYALTNEVTLPSLLETKVAAAERARPAEQTQAAAKAAAPTQRVEVVQAKPAGYEAKKPVKEARSVDIIKPTVTNIPSKRDIFKETARDYAEDYGSTFRDTTNRVIQAARKAAAENAAKTKPAEPVDLDRVVDNAVKEAEQNKAKQASAQAVTEPVPVGKYLSQRAEKAQEFAEQSNTADARRHADSTGADAAVYHSLRKEIGDVKKRVEEVEADVQEVKSNQTSSAETPTIVITVDKSAAQPVDLTPLGHSVSNVFAMSAEAGVNYREDTSRGATKLFVTYGDKADDSLAFSGAEITAGPNQEGANIILGYRGETGTGIFLAGDTFKDTSPENKGEISQLVLGNELRQMKGLPDILLNGHLGDKVKGAELTANYTLLDTGKILLDLNAGAFVFDLDGKTVSGASYGAGATLNFKVADTPAKLVLNAEGLTTDELNEGEFRAGLEFRLGFGSNGKNSPFAEPPRFRRASDFIRAETEETPIVKQPTTPAETIVPENQPQPHTDDNDDDNEQPQPPPKQGGRGTRTGGNAVESGTTTESESATGSETTTSRYYFN